MLTLRKSTKKLVNRVASNFRDTFPGFFKVFKVTFEPFSRSQIAKFKVFQGLPQHRTYIELSIISDKIYWMYNKLGIISEKFDQMYSKLGIISEKFDRMYSKLGIISRMFHQMYNKLGKISEKLDRMYNKLGIIS